MARRERRVNGRCEACRRSKVRCDEGKPRCERCIRNRLDCRYRDRSQLRFCDQTSEVASLYVAASPDSTGSSEVGSPKQQVSLQWSSHYAVKKGNLTTLTFNITPGDTVTRAGIVSLLGKYCFSDRSLFSEYCPCPPADYHMIPTIGSYSGSWSPCAYATSALAFSRGGLMTGNPDMWSQGLEMYQRALSSIRVAVSRKSTRFEPDTVLAMALIGIYESLNPATASNGQAHMTAFVNIIKWMGPAKMRTQPMHGIFLLCRINSLVNACERRRRTFFAQKDWCTIPFEYTGKPSNQEFLDLYAELCTHMEASDILDLGQESPSQEIKKRIQLQKASINLEDRMLEYDEIFERDFGVPESVMQFDAASPSPSSSPFPSDTPGFEEVLDYRSIDCAEVYMSYWTARLKLGMTIRHNNELLLALLTLPSAANDFNDDTLPTTSADISDLLERYRVPDTVDKELQIANSIARSVQYFVRQDNGIMGITPVMAPLHTAIAWFESQPAWFERAQWCRDLLSQIPALEAYQLYQALEISNPALAGSSDPSMKLLGT